MRERIAKRLFRATVSLLIAGALAIVKEDPKFLVLVPVLQAIGKYLRDRFGIKYLPI